MLLADDLATHILNHLNEVFGRHEPRWAESGPLSFSSLIVFASLELCRDEGPDTRSTVFAVRDVILLVAHADAIAGWLV